MNLKDKIENFRATLVKPDEGFDSVAYLRRIEEYNKFLDQLIHDEIKDHIFAAFTVYKDKYFSRRDFIKAFEFDDKWKEELKIVINDLVDKPVELEWERQCLKSWRLLTEVI